MSESVGVLNAVKRADGLMSHTNFTWDVVVWRDEKPHKIRASVAHATTAQPALASNYARQPPTAGWGGSFWLAPRSALHMGSRQQLLTLETVSSIGTALACASPARLSAPVRFKRGQHMQHALKPREL